ncbi:MAG: TonB-dependent receptor [Paludibacter sp.]
MYYRFTSPFLFIFLFALIISNSISATILKGKILDSKTNEPLTGAIFIDKNNAGFYDVATLDGSYSIKKINSGQHTFIVKYLGYVSQEKKITVTQNKDVIILDVLLDPEAISLNQVEVFAQLDRETSQSARNSEKNADNLLNVIPAKSIELSPDITVANVLQRVSGVTVQKTANSGEGQYAIIRGMDKRYNYTLVNGIKIPSPNDKNRYVPMDIFPAEIISHLDVIKALTPDMEGDAIGGAMNLQLKEAPDRLLVNVTGSAGYNSLFLQRPFYTFDKSVVNLKSPAEMYGTNYHVKPTDFPIENLKFNPIHPLPNFNGSFSIGDRFFNRKLGIILSLSNQNSFSGSDAFVTIPRAQPNPGTLPAFESKETRTYSTQQNRLGIHNKIDFLLNRNNTLSLYNAYFELDKYISRHSVVTSLSTGVGNTETKDRSQTQLERIYNSTLQGKHSINDRLFVDWSAAYSKAWAYRPDEVELQSNSTNIDSPILQGITHKWMHNTDRDLAGYLNISWKPENLFENTEVKAGGMYRHKNRENYFNEYSLDPVFVNNAPQLFTTIDKAKFAFSGYNADLGSPVNQNDYTVSEDVDAFYGEIKTKVLDKLNILAGVRVEQTRLAYNTPMPETFIGKSGSQAYMDVLPGMHLKYELTKKQNLRLSYFSSISRPGYFEVIPYNISGETFDEKGNPYLRRSRAQNIDFRYELFPGASEQILAGFFYKNIKDPIEYSLVRENGPSALQLKPQNFGTATNLGFEFVINKYFGNFGVSANYTFTKSSITTYKKTYQRINPQDQTSDFTTDSVRVTRPMQGQADHIANLSILYKNQKIGLDLQLSGVYTGKSISQVSGWDGLDYWSMPNTTLDFSFQKKLSRKINLSIFGKARNLLNSPAITRILKSNDYYLPGSLQLPQQDSPNSIIVQKEIYGLSFLLGLRYTL